MLIERKDIDGLNIQLNIKLEPEDYKATFEKELQRQGGKVQLKGFRKGKVPNSYLKKAFGKQVLADVVFSEASKVLSDYLKEHELKTLGRPLPSDDQSAMSFDPSTLQTYNFSFDIGLEPEFEVKGVSEEDKYKRLKVKVQDEEVDEELDRARKRMGNEVEAEGDIEENDRLVLEAKEVTDDDSGLEANFQVLVDMIGDDKVKKRIKSIKVGDTFEFNPFTLEKNAKESYVRKHMLGIEDEEVEIGTKWEAKVQAIKRIEKADMDESFYKSFLGEDVETEDQAREKVREELERFYQKQTEALLFRSFQDALLEKNDFELPKDFLKRWLESEKANENAESEEKVSTEVDQEEFDNFLKGLKWTIIRDRIADDGKVEVTETEIRQYFINSVRQYLGAYGADENLLLHSAERLMQDSGQVRKAYETLKDDKVFNYIVSQVEIEDKEIDKDELENQIEAAKA
ncbi:MAG: trigger factor [Saprospiraceae bacterium]|nr:trigger factor [Saprospiraceae bacterium]